MGYIGLVNRARLLRLVAACLLVLAAVACGHPVQRRLSGRWLGAEVENVPDGAIAAATGWARGTSFQFSGDRLTIAIPAESPRSGRYRVVSVDGPKVRLAVERPDGGEDEVVLLLDDRASMRWVLDRGRSVVLRRDG